MLAFLTAALLSAATPPAPFTQGPSVEGVTEYALPNGFRVLLLPDPSASTVTVNLTVLVGSRHEGYGEKGMAHLLEHMLFKGTPTFRDIKKDLAARSSRWNATTSNDRTNYFETMAASDSNLEWALRFEADRLINSFVDKKDLDTEMTVVRNEFERSENNPGSALGSRVRGAAMPWHNYGRAVIGVRADIERVPVSNLKAFYKRYYQPDNAVLVLSGRFDQRRAFTLVASTFGRLPRPSRTLGDTFTSEPTQDGERSVTVRRAGGAPALLAAWRIPAVSDPDYAALMVLQGVLGDAPQGRLHQTLVEGKGGLTQKAAAAGCGLDEYKEPGLFRCSAQFKEADPTGPARDAMLALLEAPRSLPEAEVARARDGWLSEYEQALANTEALAFELSEWSARGDWRLYYLLRDRLKAVKAADVERVWGKYLKPQNRTLGEYVPTAAPDRAEVADAPDAKAVLASFKGGEAVQQGEAFDPSVKAIEARTRRLTLANGAQLLLLPKKTRAQTVKLVLDLKLGTAATLTGQAAVSQLTASLLNRGTKALPYKDYASKLEQLKSTIAVGGRGQTVQVFVTTQRPQLDEVLALVHDVLQAPALDAAELEVLRGELASRLDGRKGDPTTLGSIELARALSPLPPEHVNAVLPIAEQLAALKAVTVEQVRAFHGRFYGAQSGAAVVVGDFEPAAVEQRLSAMLGAWTAKERFERAADPFVAVKGEARTLPTPDKPNAWLGTGTTVPLVDTAPDYPAMRLAAEVLGGGVSGRLFAVLREQQGLTYGAYAGLRVDPLNDRGVLMSNVTFAPQNLAAVEKGLAGELARWATVTPAELDATRKVLLDGRYQSRANDDELAGQLASLATLGRTLAWEGTLDEALQAVTAAQVNAAVKKFVDPSALVTVRAGDFKTVSAPR